MNWIIKNWPAALLLCAGICACVATFFLSKQDQEQKDLIQKLGQENVNLAKGVENLDNLNNEIGAKIEKMTEINNTLSRDTFLLSKQNRELISEVQLLTRKSQELLSKVNERTFYPGGGNKQTGVIMKFKPFKQGDFVSVKIGETRRINTISQINAGARLFRVKDKDLLSANFENNKIYIHLKIFDLSGSPVAEISNNKWLPGKDFRGKLNYDSKGFEVIDSEGKVAVSIDFLKHNKLRVQGIFPFKEDNLLILAGKTSVTLSFEDSAELMGKMLKNVKIKQLFEYTGKHWLHKRRK